MRIKQFNDDGMSQPERERTISQLNSKISLFAKISLNSKGYEKAKTREMEIEIRDSDFALTINNTHAEVIIIPDSFINQDDDSELTDSIILDNESLTLATESQPVLEKLQVLCIPLCNICNVEFMNIEKFPSLREIIFYRPDNPEDMLTSNRLTADSATPIIQPGSPAKISSAEEKLRNEPHLLHMAYEGMTIKAYYEECLEDETERSTYYILATKNGGETYISYDNINFQLDFFTGELIINELRLDYTPHSLILPDRQTYRGFEFNVNFIDLNLNPDDPTDKFPKRSQHFVIPRCNFICYPAASLRQISIAPPSPPA